MNKEPFLKRFVLSTKKLVAKIPKYSSKFSNKIYDNHQKFAILILKQRLKMTYRSISPVYRLNGGAKLEFHKKVYHQRSKVETVFFVIKRKYGSFILSKSFESQKEELIFRLIAYNIDRKMIFSLWMIRVSPEPLFKTFIKNSF